MPPRLFPYAFLLSLGVISTFASQDLRYYQADLIPDPPTENLGLKQLARLLEARNQNAPYGSLFRGGKEQQLRDLERAKELKGTRQLLDAEKSEILLQAFSKRRQKHHSNYFAAQIGDDLGDNVVVREYPDKDPREFYSYLNPASHIRAYPGYSGPLTEANSRQINTEYQTDGYRFQHQDVREHGMKEEPLPDFRGKYRSRQTIEHPNLEAHYTGGRVNDREKTEPDFTYNFGEPSYQNKEPSFAAKPNEPWFYQDAPAFGYTGVQDTLQSEERTERIMKNDEETKPSSEESAILPDPVEESTRNDGNDEVNVEESRVVPGLHSPLVMAIDRKISNDIYFVAVVAGCSAAAMFILVLISLTWCRLQRGAKAAADVEYPAYGVTGPNKDTSPSGDRRLAQSAQMYHYQHQKQQIIAMESRTATARDPGSVSEAESDEENEEGDYTVYECPGLAPTGEMEVKNPLFHDDPTPATPAGQGQSSRSGEDHM